MERRAFLSGLMLVCAGCMSRQPEITVGSKNFTEQLVLGELLAQYLETVCRTPYSTSTGAKAPGNFRHLKRGPEGPLYPSAYGLSTHDPTAYGLSTHDPTAYGLSTHDPSAYGLSPLYPSAHRLSPLYPSAHRLSTHYPSAHGLSTHDPSAHRLSTHRLSTHYPYIERRFYLAGTYICHQALLAGRIDMYVEYTGTALAAILKETFSGDSRTGYELVKKEYKRRFDLDVMPPLGFNNSFAMVMRGDDARRLGVSKLSQLASAAPQLRLGVGYEFLERLDGYKGLVSAYGLKFAEAPRVMDLGLLYRALENKSVDIVAGNNTDGLIAALGLVVLEDDKRYFPPYDAVPIVRPQVFQECPQARAAFERLAGRIAADDMRQMNYAVDGEKKDVADAVREFLQRQGLQN